MSESPLSRNGLEIHRAHACPIDTFHVIGERCSGTNIARWLVEKNLHLRHRPFLGWKHGFPSSLAISPTSLVVAVFRDATTWVQSLYRKPFHTHPDLRALPFEAFIRAPWHSHIDRPKHLGVGRMPDIKYALLQQDLHPLTGAPFENCLALRNAKTAGFLSYRRRDVNLVLLRHETFMADKEGVLAEIGKAFDLAFVRPLIDSDANMGSGSFTAQKSRTPLSAADRAHIVAHLDMALETDLGYRYDADAR